MSEPGFVTPHRARLIRVLLDSEHQDAVRAGEVPPGPRPLGSPKFPPPAPRRHATRRADPVDAPAGLW